MTKKEFQIRENAVLSAFRDNSIEEATTYEMELYERNCEKKFYRFRPPKEYEIDDLKESEIYLCRPRVFDDLEDCEWIDNIKELVQYRVQNLKEYKKLKKQVDSNIYEEVENKLRQNPRYIKMQEKAKNMCLIACVTDKMNDYMWEHYASDSEGICLEYDIEEVLDAIKNLNIRIFPVRYVDDRLQTKDIQFGVEEYEEETGELMERKYILSCMTKNKIPYARESEWRTLCENVDDEIVNGKKFDFIKPCKIYLGKNCSNNNRFHEEIIKVAKELGIPICDFSIMKKLN